MGPGGKPGSLTRVALHAEVIRMKVRLGRKGARMDATEWDTLKCSGLDQTFHCVSQFCGLGIWGKALLGEPSCMTSTGVTLVVFSWYLV